jgi:hypothetical protein
MKRDQLLQQLQDIRDKGSQALRLLELGQLTPEVEAEVRSLTEAIKVQLEIEYQRTTPERAQKTMSLFELSVYSPTIEEAWKTSGIRRLKTAAPPDKKWEEPLEAVVYTADKYLR